MVYIILNTYKFLRKFEKDFERGNLYFYYPNHFYITLIFDDQLMLYKNDLILNENDYDSKYTFYPSYFFSHNYKYKKNVVFFLY